jgi:hypothetical protein
MTGQEAVNETLADRAKATKVIRCEDQEEFPSAVKEIKQGPDY